VVELPPLRALEEDIFLFVSHFASERARTLGRSEPLIHRDVIQAMSSYSFPGNVRELKNMVEQAVLLCGGTELGLEDFPVLGRTAGAPAVSDRAMPDPSPSGGGPGADAGLGEIRARHGHRERERLVDALERFGGNVSAAARHLNMSRHQIRRRIAKYGLG
jgi:two-component system response regulator HydG